MLRSPQRSVQVRSGHRRPRTRGAAQAAVPPTRSQGLDGLPGDPAAARALSGAGSRALAPRSAGQRHLYPTPARAWEPKRLRLRLFSAAGRLVRSGRRLRLRLAATWPWADQLTTAITRLQALAPG